jgi:hypothetical protein
MHASRIPWVSGKRPITFLAGVLVFSALHLTGRYIYLIFHSLAELFSVGMAVSIFVVYRNSRRFVDNHYSELRVGPVSTVTKLWA